MDAEKSKPILICIAVACLAGAGIFLYVNMGGGVGAGSTKPIPMICVACGHTYEMSVKEFQKSLSQQNPDPMMSPMAMSRFDCPKCNKNAVQAGMKCPECSTIYAAAPMRNPQMKCPKCGKTGH